MLLSRILQGRICRLSAIVVLAGLVGACGFRPLYGQLDQAGLAAEQHLALVDIGLIQDRIGQQLRNDLLNGINPSGEPDRPIYHLSVSIAEAITNLGVKKSSVVTRGNLSVSATYSLTRLQGDGAVTSTLTNGIAKSISSYDIPQAQFAAQIARKDARARAIKEIADDIKTRLAVYFRQNPDKL